MAFQLSSVLLVVLLPVTFYVGSTTPTWTQIQTLQLQDMKETALNSLEGLADLQGSCPPGTSLLGPTGLDGILVTDNGRTAAICTRPDGTYHGPSIIWYANGSKATAGDYREGLKEGIWHFWHENGKISGQGIFCNNKPDGLWVTWHDNGQKESEGSYLNGLHQGRFTHWDRNGQIAQILEYDHGNLIKRIQYQSGINNK